jgi:hypothetical protein
MPANTPKGFPYPVGTDRVMDGDDAIKNLATAVDTMLGTAAAAMVTSAVPGSLNTPVSTAITFPAGRFTTPPQLVATINGSAGQAFGAITATGVTATGAVLWFTKLSGGLAAVQIMYIALQNP